MSIEEAIKFTLKIFKEVLGKNFEVERFEATYIPFKDEKLVRLEGEDLKKFLR
jgi:20S proteasome alpha/beta subunit